MSDSQAWYYTTGCELNKIVEAGSIQPDPPALFNPPVPLVWLSVSPAWDAAASKGTLLPNGQFQYLTTAEVHAQADGLFRIGVVDAAAQERWADVEKKTQAVRSFVKEVKQRGANPKQWRFSRSPIGVAQWTVLQAWNSERATWVDEPLAGTEFIAIITEMVEATLTLGIAEKLVPAITLIYTALDTMAWLGIRDRTSRTTGLTFTSWVERYVLQYGHLAPCTATDLYGARCGLLHTHSPLSAVKGARPIVYMSGTDMAKDWQPRLDSTGQNTIAIDLRELVAAAVRGLHKFADELVADKEHSAIVRAKVARMFPTTPASKHMSAQARSKLIKCV
jgi:hypothetical protein